MREILKDERIERGLILNDIFEGGETAIIASRKLVDLEVKKVKAAFSEISSIVAMS